MKIIVGSKNPTKVKAVQEVFKMDQITMVAAPSNVSSQPLSDEETRQGAMNRARNCVATHQDVVGIGLEGGIMSIGNELYLTNWGALATPDHKLYTAAGARILLPQEIGVQLKGGIELGQIMDVYAKKQDISKREGAIGILTNNLISRQDVFIHIAALLKGQWEY